uniref:Uncharacterized protein LOC110217528 n=1 Tax=Phascolarctos cinereus TaxID=38626 RepID=A0A6P5LBE5_PHACI|nr:uncharacterized protein LOC110217528 [Phascolarctos cinereus]XP_020855595.1 uncharacterized protein LOC110217528 [Phascolarctos cinereus]
MPASLLWHRCQATNTGQLPYLKHQGMMSSFLPKKYHANAFGLTLPSLDFRTKVTVEHLTTSKQFVMPPLVPVHQLKTSVKLKNHQGATSGTDPLPKISPGHDYQSKQRLPCLKHQPQPLASSNHRVTAAPPSTKRKRSKTMNEPSVPPHSQTSSSSVPTSKSHIAEVHRSCRRQLKIATDLLGGFDLWPKDVVIKPPSPEDHSNTTDSEKTSDQPYPEIPPKPVPFLKFLSSKKERPILRTSETIILSLIFNNKSRDKPAPSSFAKFISRGTNTNVPWPQNKNTSPGPNHQTRLNARPSPDWPWARTTSVPFLPPKIWETSMPQTTVTWPDHIAEASPGPDYKVKDTFGPSLHPVRPVIIPLPGRNQSGEIPPGINDQATDPWGLYYWFEVSRGQGHQDSSSMNQSSKPEASASKTPVVTVPPLNRVHT